LTILLAAGEASLNAIGMTETVFPTWRTLYERCLANARTQLGEAEFNIATAEGQAMTLEQAVKYALEDARED
jgi:hypothetical protein